MKACKAVATVGRKYKVERGYVCSAGIGVGVGVVSSSVIPEKRTDRGKG